MVTWAEKELETLDLEHKAKDRNAKAILHRLGEIAESTPDACRSKRELDRTYEFMGNRKVKFQSIMQAHHDQARKRTAERKQVVLVQDTTEIDLTKPRRQVQGAGPLDADSRRGVYLHPLMAYTTDGVPLGLVDEHIWARESIDTTSTPQQKSAKRQAMPIEDKESIRWVHMVQSGKQLAAEHPDTQYIGVSDSESDVFEVLAETVERPDNYDLIVRGCQDRALLDCDVQQADGSACRRLGDVLRNSPVLLTRTVEVREREPKVKADKRARRQPRVSRMAQLEIRATTITLRPPYRAGVQLPPVTLNVVEAREVNPPPGEEPVVWILLTTLSILSVEDLEFILAMYELRWLIEIYFRTLKSGLGVEDMQYQTVDRYLNATSFLLIIAWRIQLLTQAARHEPETPSSEYFSASEWKSTLLILRPGQPLPSIAPTLGEFLILVARLGGYIVRRGQGPPGVHTLWRGLHRLSDYSLAYQTFGPSAP